MRLRSMILRRLTSAPLFTLTIVLLLAIGIGASSAIFSIVDAILFRRLTLPHSESLVRVFGSDERGGELSSSLSYPEYRDYAEQSHAFAGLAAYSDGVSMNLAVRRELPARISGAVVTGNYFDVLGVHAVRGRLIEPADDAHGGHAVVVISHRLWRERFASDRSIVGRTVRLNGHPFTIIGIAAPGFGGIDLESLSDLFVPISDAPLAMPEFRSGAGEPSMFDNRHFSWVAVVGRLASGVTAARAQAELRTIAKRQPPSSGGSTSATVISAEQAALDLDTQGKTERISWFLFAFVLLVLVLSGGDAGALMLARVRRQRREMAIRLALGASRRSIAAQLLGDSLLLAALGATCGAAVAAAMRTWLFAVAARALPYPIEAARPLDDARVLAFAALTAAAVAVLMTLVPMPAALRSTVMTALKDGGEPARTSRLRFRAGDVFVIAQVAVSLAIVVATGLVLRSILNLNRVDPGFHPDHAVAVSVDLARQGYTKQTGPEVIERLRQAVTAIPGVEAAALARSVPVQQAGMRMTMTVRGHRPPIGSDEAADLNIVTPGYFRAMGIPLLAGRDFAQSDRHGTHMVCIVDETLAKRYWPDGDALGRSFQDVGPTSQEAEIVGIVRDVKTRSLRQAAPATIYLPVAQFYNGSMTIVVRSPRSPRDVLGDVSRAITQIDPGLPAFYPRTLREKLELSILQERMIGSLLTLFGAIALLLTMAGVGGVLLYSVAARTKELGVRTAVGAQPRDLRVMVLKRTVMQVAGGCAIGLAAATAFAKLTTGVLFGIAPTDPLTYAGAALLLLASGLAAAQWPATRAARVDPLVALRHE